MSSEYCVSCGEEIPEGLQVCYQCLEKSISGNTTINIASAGNENIDNLDISEIFQKPENNKPEKNPFSKAIDTLILFFNRR